jgi:hypothetical protein
MHDLFINPAFQSGIVPLFCGLIVALILRPFGIMWQGLAVVCGLVSSVMLTIGISFRPLTSTHKIILSSIVLPFASFLPHHLPCRTVCQTVFMAILSGVTALWVVWPVLAHQEGLQILISVSKMVLYASVVGGSVVWFGKEDLARQGGGLLALGTGTGILAFIASSALYGQLAIAVTAALGGLLLVLLIIPDKDAVSISLGNFGLVAAKVPLAIIGGGSTVFANLPAAALFSLVLVPMFAAIPVARQQNLWVRGSLATILGFLPIIPAIWYALSTSGTMGY